MDRNYSSSLAAPLVLALAAGCGRSATPQADGATGAGALAEEEESLSEEGGGLGPESEPADGSGDGLDQDPPVPELPAVTLLSATCASGTELFVPSACGLLRVDAGDALPILLELRVFDPEPALPIQGTVVLGTGGDGTAFYEERPGGDLLLADLLELGYRVVSRRWVTSWVDTVTGVRAASRRYAELLRWIRAELHGAGPLCAVGNSGGASEIAYGLASWGLGDVLDVAVLTNGPGLARIDFQCLPPTSEWSAQCAALVAPAEVTCGTPACTASAGSPVCAFFAQETTAVQLLEESVLHPQAVLDYPQTAVRVLVGADDCTVSTAQAALYRAALLGPSAFEVVSATPHGFSSSAEGRSAIVAALLQAPLALDAGAGTREARAPRLDGSRRPFRGAR